MSTSGIYGLSGSGIDVESMVKVGMLSKQNQYDKMYKAEVKQEWEKEKFTNVYSEVATFGMSKLTDYKLQSNMNAMAAATTNTGAMTVSANGAATAMTHKIQINELSSNAYLMSTEAVKLANTDSSAKDSIKLSDVAFQSIEQDSSVSTKYHVTDANGKTTTVNASDTAISFKLSDGVTELTDADSTVSFTYAELASGVTLNDLASKINKLGTHIRASYDSVNDAFSLYNSEGGIDNKISITASAGTQLTPATSARISSSSAVTYANTLGDGQEAFLDQLDNAKKAVQYGTSTYNLVEGETNVYASANGKATFTQEENGSYTYHTQRNNSGTNALNFSADKSTVSDGTRSYTLDTETGIYKSDTGNGKWTIEVSDDESTYTYSVANYNVTEGYSYTDENGDAAFISADKVSTDSSTLTANGSTAVTDVLGITLTDEQKESDDIALSFDLNGKSFMLAYKDLDGMTLANLASAIGQNGANVAASMTSDGTFTLKDNNSTGSSSSLTISNVSGLGADLLGKLNISTMSATGADATYGPSDVGQNTTALLNNLNLGVSRNGDLGDALTFSAGVTNTTSGSNGEVIIDGKKYTDSITNNRITVGGVTYNLLNTTESAATVTVTQDTDSIVDRVKSFVDDYNKMLDYLYDLYTEQKYSDYQPLTKSQENAMTKEQVEKWNEKAKSGLLYHNKIIGDIISDMRNALSTPVDGTTGKYNSAFSLGISVTKTNGHIELDESKLKQVLATEPDSVYQVFGKLDDVDDDFDKIGVAQRLGDVMNDAMKKIKDYAGTSTSVDDDSTLGNSIRDWQTKMSNFQLQLNAYETKLFAKYDLMEQMIQKMGMQMNYILGSSS